MKKIIVDLIVKVGVDRVLGVIAEFLKTLGSNERQLAQDIESAVDGYNRRR